MATFETQGMSTYYETHGTRGNPPILLISGLGGTGRSWGALVARFARDHFVVLPDQRGTGKTTHTEDGYELPQLATDMASLLRHLDLGPAHVIGSSTGGAIAQHMALKHSDVVRSLILGSSFAKPDAFLRSEFALRRKLAAEADPRALYHCYALFLFSPRFWRNRPEVVEEWIQRCAAAPLEREISLKRIDMIMTNDTLGRLGEIRRPTLVVVGDHDFCTPPQLSEELARGIPAAELRVLQGGHLIHDEDADGFFTVVHEFLARN